MTFEAFNKNVHLLHNTYEYVCLWERGLESDEIFVTKNSS